MTCFLKSLVVVKMYPMTLEPSFPIMGAGNFFTFFYLLIKKKFFYIKQMAVAYGPDSVFGIYIVNRQ